MGTSQPLVPGTGPSSGETTSADAARDVERGSSWVNARVSQESLTGARRDRSRGEGGGGGVLPPEAGRGLEPPGSHACPHLVLGSQPASRGAPASAVSSPPVWVVFQQPRETKPRVLLTVTGAPATQIRFHPRDTARRKHSQPFSPDQTPHKQRTSAGRTDRPELFSRLSVAGHSAVPCCLLFSSAEPSRDLTKTDKETGQQRQTRSQANGEWQH